MGNRFLEIKILAPEGLQTNAYIAVARFYGQQRGSMWPGQRGQPL